MNRIYILLGGFLGVDGYVTSAGMIILRTMLAALPNVICLTYQWANFEAAAADIAKQPKDTKIIVIGYSGGGWRAVSLANLPAKPHIDLMVCYDPSPTWKLDREHPLGPNVKRTISYHNTSPFFFGFGGGVVRGAQVEQVDISMNHMAVQASVSLHQRTVAEVRKVLKV